MKTVVAQPLTKITPKLQYYMLVFPYGIVVVVVVVCVYSDADHGYTALMFAAIEGDEIIADILVACVSQ